MKIGLIAMSGIRVVNPDLKALGLTLPGFVDRGRVIASLPSLGLLTIAGMTPPRHAVTYLEFDDLAEADDLPDFDLVGISSLTARIDDAYELADRFRRRGTAVVLGGLHVSVMPEEAATHCDAVMLGSSEAIWPMILADVEGGCLKSRYAGSGSAVFEKDYTMPAFELLAGRSFNRVTVQTSRGCPRACEFCGASRLISPHFQQKSVAKVIREIRRAREWIDQPFFEFADDNTFLNREWGKSFLRALIPEQIRWFTETDASVGHDPELCDLLAASGCRQVLIGFESPRPDDLTAVDPHGWKAGMVARYQDLIASLQGRGVSVNGCFILGLDSHTPDIFPAVRDFVKESGLAEVQCTVLTPFPGTELYARLQREGRLLADRFWDRCTLFDVNYRPSRMSVEQLEKGLRWLFGELYSEVAYAARKRAFIAQRKASSAGVTAF
jgi:radical SAM superfamily enzyme YgiQ (UPF0313 family)